MILILFGFGILVGLLDNSSDVSENTGLTVPAFRHLHLTQLRDSDPSRAGLPVLVYMRPEINSNDLGGGGGVFGIN